MGENEQHKQLQSAVAGDTHALEALLAAHRKPVLQYVERHLPERLRRLIEPQDVFQDVCFEAFRGIGRFTPDGDDSLLRWLLTIARSRITDLIRAEEAQKRGGGRRIEDAGDETLLQLLTELKVYQRTPSRSAAAHQLLAAVEVALERLADDHRQVVRLRHLEGLSVRETAQRMDRSEAAVAMLCGRALRALRVELRSASRYL